jgi:hypothetical protein
MCRVQVRNHEGEGLNASTDFDLLKRHLHSAFSDFSYQQQTIKPIKNTLKNVVINYVSVSVISS